MSTEPYNDDAKLHEELVAYLDGEMDAAESRRMEQRLADDPDSRTVLQEFDRTWQLLDQLGAPVTDHDFTRTTMEMVAVAAAEDARRIKTDLPRKTRRNWLLAGASLLSATLAGFIFVALALPDSNTQLLKDLPVIENFDQYRSSARGLQEDGPSHHVDDIEFLRMLKHDKVFSEDLDEGQ